MYAISISDIIVFIEKTYYVKYLNWFRYGWQEGEAVKAKVINSFSDYYNEIVNVKLLNFKYVSCIVNGIMPRVKIPYEDVEFVYDYEWEKYIVKYRDMLRISLPAEVSPKFYALLSKAFEQHIKTEIKSIAVLSDINEYPRRKYWYKRMVAVVNDKYPVLVTSSGKKYSNCYNINIEDLERDKFINDCKCGIEKVKSAIETGTKQLDAYERILCSVKNSKYDKAELV